MTKPGIVIRFSLLCAAFFIVLYRLFYINDFGFPRFLGNTSISIHGLSVWLAMFACLLLTNATLRKYFPSMPVVEHFKWGILMVLLAEFIFQLARLIFLDNDFEQEILTGFLNSLLKYLVVGAILAFLSAVFFGRKK